MQANDPHRRNSGGRGLITAAEFYVRWGMIPGHLELLKDNPLILLLWRETGSGEARRRLVRLAEFGGDYAAALAEKAAQMPQWIADRGGSAAEVLKRILADIRSFRRAEAAEDAERSRERIAGRISFDAAVAQVASRLGLSPDDAAMRVICALEAGDLTARREPRDLDEYNAENGALVPVARDDWRAAALVPGGVRVRGRVWRTREFLIAETGFLRWLQRFAPVTPLEAHKVTNTAACWMLDYTAGRAVPPKRDVALKDCQTAVGCSYREARAAWNALPSERKRSARQTDRAMKADRPGK